VLAEAHDEAELDRALALETPLVGINNRNLRDFSVSLDTCIRLAARIPKDKLVVAESGIGSHADIQTVQKAGVNVFLVGESLLRQPDVGAATHALLTGAVKQPA
jgi:indole-3-glycerol phosphate synthase